MRRKLIRITLGLVLLLVAGSLGAGFWARGLYLGSLPQLEGTIGVQSIRAPVSIDRDNLGIPTIKAANRSDLAFATGFAHAQDRLFQMDLLRRNAAGELAELVGRAAVPLDRRTRVHRFRSLAKRVLEQCPAEDKMLIESYTRGVNAGAQSLAKQPFEYQLLRQTPKPWLPEDGSLVQLSMFLDLQLDEQTQEYSLCLMRDTLPEPLFAFLAQRGSEWDAPLDDSKLPEVSLPGPEVIDLRKKPADKLHAFLNPTAGMDSLTLESASIWSRAERPFEGVHVGSNNWAVSGKRTKHGGAIVCDDMHLRFGVPHIWYRASYEWMDAAGKSHKATGVTLPGTPAIVVGSNGHVAWGFTNSEADWSDLVIVETDPTDPKLYRTAEGTKAIETIVEEIPVQGSTPEKLEIRQTIWGPIIGKDAKGRPLAHRWVAHDIDGVNMRFAHMESAQSMDEALELANRSGIPGQNFVVGDATGKIAWTIAGRLPRRFGHDGRLPASWADGKSGWNGYRDVAEYPRIVDPPSGQIWTANARVVGGKFLETLGFGNYDLGARARQIRDDLVALGKVDESDMIKVHLDDKAVFLGRWQKLFLETLSSQVVADKPQLAEMNKFVESWGERAAINSVGYRLVREFRLRVSDRLLAPLTQPCKKADPNFHYVRAGQIEAPLWTLVSKRPLHLIEAKYKSWDGLLLAAVDDVAKVAFKERETLAGWTHGEVNRLNAQHPLSRAVQGLGPMLDLDMPADPLPGDSAHMPRIQSATHGASQRMAVSPGNEASGYMQMPCGQSGHPASPHYRDQHAAWAKGEPAPFLPGKTIHQLTLTPN